MYDMLNRSFESSYVEQTKLSHTGIVSSLEKCVVEKVSINSGAFKVLANNKKGWTKTFYFMTMKYREKKKTSQSFPFLRIYSRSFMPLASFFSLRGAVDCTRCQQYNIYCYLFMYSIVGFEMYTTPRLPRRLVNIHVKLPPGVRNSILCWHALV